MGNPIVGILHYTAPPITGGVEAVIQAHARQLSHDGYPLTVIAGRGDENVLPDNTRLALFPILDSQHPEIVRMNEELELGKLPDNFEKLTAQMTALLQPVVQSLDVLIVHNVLSKHFNLALTTAILRLLDGGKIRRLVAWCHDLSWTSPSSRSKVHPGYPWDDLRTYREDITYVTVSESRKREMSELFGCSPERIQVIYNGVDAGNILGLSLEGNQLVDQLGLLEADLLLLMPVRITRAKNFEYAIRVVKALQQTSLRVKLVVTGPPDPHDPDNMRYFHSLLEQCKQLKIEDSLIFVYASDYTAGQPRFLDERAVGDLYRVSDALFMPSHREGFGMPVLEAGFAGIPVFCTASPAAVEIGGPEVVIFSLQQDAEEVAALIISRLEACSQWRLRKRLRKQYTWDSLFEQKIIPLLHSA